MRRFVAGVTICRHSRRFSFPANTVWSSACTSGGMFRLLPLTAALAVSAFAADPPDPAKISPPLVKLLNDNRPVNVIVRFVEPPTPKTHAIIRLRGGVLRQEMAFIKSAAYRVRGNTLAAIAADPRVVWISADGPVTTPVEVTGEQ